MKLISIVLAVILLSSYAIAQDEHPIDKLLAEWMIKSNGDTSKINDSLDKACGLWEAEMNKYYNLMLAQHSERIKEVKPAFKPAFKEAKIAFEEQQAGWLSYRDFVLKTRASEIRSGMEGLPTVKEYNLELVRTRALRFKAFAELEPIGKMNKRTKN